MVPPTGAPFALLRDRATQALPLSPPLQKSNVPPLAQRGEEAESAKFLLLTLLSLACIAGVLAASGVAYCLRHRAHHRLKEKLSALGADAGSDAPAAYQVRTELSSSGAAPLPGRPSGGPFSPGESRGWPCFRPFPPAPVPFIVLRIPCSSFLLLGINLGYSGIAAVNSCLIRNI